MSDPMVPCGSTESSPLLPKGSTRDAKDDARKAYPIKLRLWLIMILISVGEELQESPQTRILESVICYRYYEEFDPNTISIGRTLIGPGAIAGVTERFCKANAVQSELSAIRGFQQFLDGIPALLLAIPIGRAADLYGRRPVLCFGLLSLILRALWMQSVTWWWQAFDVRATWLSTLHMLLGGGSMAVTGPLYAMVSDVSVLGGLDLGKEFLRLNTASLLAALLTQPISAGLMRINPWIPDMLGTGIMILGLVLSISTPETLNFRTINYLPRDRDSAIESPVDEDRDATSSSLLSWPILALISPLTCHMLLNKVKPFLLQFCSSRYGLAISEATWLLALFSAGKALLLFSLLPLVSDIVKRRWCLSNQQKDLFFARASQLVMLVGWALVGMAPNLIVACFALIITSLGFGVFALSRSLLTSVVPNDQVGRIYGIVAVADTVGAMLGGISLSKLYGLGLRLGVEWEGLPFYALSLLCLVCLAFMLMVKIRSHTA